MDSWVRFSAQSQAKERVFRAAQYACTLLSYALEKNGAGPDFLARIKQLEAHLSLGRKLLSQVKKVLRTHPGSRLLFYRSISGRLLWRAVEGVECTHQCLWASLLVFRLGNSADALEAAKRAIHLSDIVLRFCITVSHLNRAMYFACDNILWAGKSGLIPHMDQEKWSQRSFRYYLFALIMSLSRDAYEIRLLMEREMNGKHCKSSCGNDGFAPGEDHRIRQLALGLKQRLCLLVRVLRSNPPLLLDMMKNACDVFIPLDKLGMCQSSSGFVGFCGLMSSILSILTIVHPWLKLKP